MPFNLLLILSAFQKRAVKKGLVEVTGLKVNQGAGYSLDILCNYHFYGSQTYIQKHQTLVKNNILMDCCSVQVLICFVLE